LKGENGEGGTILIKRVLVPGATGQIGNAVYMRLKEQSSAASVRDVGLGGEPSKLRGQPL
jgi:hypothetical protein